MKVQEEEARNTVCCYHHLIFIFTILLLTLALRLGPTAKLNVEAIIVPVEYKAEKQLYRCTSGQIERASKQATSKCTRCFHSFVYTSTRMIRRQNQINSHDHDHIVFPAKYCHIKLD